MIHTCLCFPTTERYQKLMSFYFSLELKAREEHTLSSLLCSSLTKSTSGYGFLQESRAHPFTSESLGSNEKQKIYEPKPLADTNFQCESYGICYLQLPWLTRLFTTTCFANTKVIIHFRAQSYAMFQRCFGLSLRKSLSLCKLMSK